MRFLQFQHHFQHFLAISLADIKLVEPDFDHRRLVEWQKKGYLQRIRRGFYILSDTMAHLQEESLFAIANKIYSPSYVSLETALSFYNFIPEMPFTVTSVSSRKTQEFETELGRFHYRSIKPELMFGYRLLEIPGQRFQQKARLAEPEKAILDFLYYNQDYQCQQNFSSLRLNLIEIFEECNLQKFEHYLARFSSSSMQRRGQAFLSWLSLAETE
jgi:predicted transcriptional regulator of viral defense system